MSATEWLNTIEREIQRTVMPITAKRDTTSMAAALRAVLALHEPMNVTLAKRDANGRRRGTYTEQRCEHCAVTEDPYIAVSTDWPCPTVAIIANALDVAP